MTNPNAQEKRKKKKKKKQNQQNEEVELISENELMSEDGDVDGEGCEEESEEELRRKKPLSHVDLDGDGNETSRQNSPPCPVSGAVWPRFLFIEGDRLKGVSVLKAGKAIVELIGESQVLNVKRHANGSLAVEVLSQEASIRTLELRQLCGCPVKVSPQRGFNTR
jgi:hypothetical protein